MTAKKRDEKPDENEATPEVQWTLPPDTSMTGDATVRHLEEANKEDEDK